MESLADIQALAHRVAWDLMDEAQRDDLMEKVVVPRWGDITSDGVVLKGTAWAKIIGTTVNVIEGRFYRLSRSEGESKPLSSGPTTDQKGSIRSARSAMRKHPDLAKQLVADPEIAELVADALRAVPRAPQPAQDPQKTQPPMTALTLTGDLVEAHVAIRRFVQHLSSWEGRLGLEAKEVCEKGLAECEAALGWARTLVDENAPMTDEALHQWLSEAES